MKFKFSSNFLILFANCLLPFCFGMDHPKRPRIIYLPDPPPMQQVSPGSFRNFVMANTSDRVWKAKNAVHKSLPEGNNANNNYNDDVNAHGHMNVNDDDDDVVFLGSRNTIRPTGKVFLDFSAGMKDPNQTNHQAFTSAPADQNTDRLQEKLNQSITANANDRSATGIIGHQTNPKELEFQIPNEQSNYTVIAQQQLPNSWFFGKHDDNAMPKLKKHINLPKWLSHSSNKQSENAESSNKQTHNTDHLNLQSMTNQPTDSEHENQQTITNFPTNYDTLGTLAPWQADPTKHTVGSNVADQSAMGTNSDQQTLLQLSPPSGSSQFKQIAGSSDQFSMSNHFDQTLLAKQSFFINSEFPLPNQSTNSQTGQQQLPNTLMSFGKQYDEAGAQILPKRRLLLPEWLQHSISHLNENAENSNQKPNNFDQANLTQPLNHPNQTNQLAAANRPVLNHVPNRINSFDTLNLVKHFGRQQNDDQTNQSKTDNQMALAMSMPPTESAGNTDGQQHMGMQPTIVLPDQKKVLTLSSETTEMPEKGRENEQQFAATFIQTTKAFAHPRIRYGIENFSSDPNRRGQKRPFEEPSRSSSVNNQNNSGNELVYVVRHLFELSLSAIGILHHYIEKPLALVMEGAPMEAPLVRQQFEIMTKILRQMDPQIVEGRISEHLFGDERVKNDNLLRHIFKKIQKQAVDMFGHKLFEKKINETEKKNEGRAEILFFFMHLYNKMVKILEGEHYEKDQNTEELRVALHKWIKAAKERVSFEFQQFFKKNVTDTHGGGQTNFDY